MEIIKPRQYPPYEQIENLHLTLNRATPRKTSIRLSIDDLYEAFKQKLEEDGFIYERR